MTSVYNTLFIELQARILAALPDTPTVPGIRMVVKDVGQIDEYETRPNVTFPCVLINYTGTDWEQKQLKIQQGKMNIQLRLAFEPLTSNSLAPLAVREQALFYHELESKLYLILQDWNANGLLLQPMKRTGDADEPRKDFHVRRINFKATYEDQTLRTGGVIIPPINPHYFRIDWTATSSINYVQDDRLKGKTVAHILQVSWEGDDKFVPIATGTPTDKQVKLDPDTGQLIFLNSQEIDDVLFAVVLTN